MVPEVPPAGTTGMRLYGDPLTISLDVVGRARENHHVGQIGQIVAAHPLEGGRHDVMGIADQVGDGGCDIVLANHGFELGQQDRIDLNRLSPVRARASRDKACVISIFP